MVTLKHFGSWHGPNPLSEHPVVMVQMAITKHKLVPLFQASKELQAICDDWYKPPKKLADQSSHQVLGTFLADWALQALTYVRGYLLSAGCQRENEDGKVQLYLGFHQVPLSFAALQLGAKWLCKLSTGEAVVSEFESELNNFWQACRRHHPDYQARIIMQAAQAQGIPYSAAWGLPRHWRFGQGAKSRVLMETSSCDDGAFAARVAGSKSVTKAVMRTLGLPTPVAVLIKDASEMQQAIKQVGLPCVTKPIDGSQGRGVSTNLCSLDEACEGFRVSRTFTNGPILVEAFVTGNDYRLMVVAGKLQAVIRRDPPHVVGDGERTIAELVVAKNIGRDIRSPLHSGYCWPILLDASAYLCLAGQGLTAQTILIYGQRVVVRSNSNLSTGGDCIDVSDTVHPQIQMMAETLANTLNLNMMGADYQTADISQAPKSRNGGFIEINTTPGFSALMAAGWSAERAGILALGKNFGRIKSTLIVVANNDYNMVENKLIASLWPCSTGWASKSVAFLSDMQLKISATDNPWGSVAALLSHRSLSSIVIVVTSSELYQHGLPMEKFDNTLLFTKDLRTEWQTVIDSCTSDLRLIEVEVATISEDYLQQVIDM